MYVVCYYVSAHVHDVSLGVCILFVIYFACVVSLCRCCVYTCCVIVHCVCLCVCVLRVQ